MSGRKRKALGKGLGEIFPGIEGEAEFTISGGVDVDLIDPNPYQPRIEWSNEDIASLAASIKAQGILQPLVLRKRGRRYQLIAGERRLRAAKEAGLSSVPAVVREADDRQMLALALMENLQRRDLGPIEKAEGFRRLAEDFGLTQQQIAEQVGFSRPAVANFMRLLELPDAVQDLLRAGRLQMGHGRALLGLKDAASIERTANQAAKRGYSVRQTEELVRLKRKEGSPRPRSRRAGNASKDKEIRKLEESLQRLLMTRVRISEVKGSGKGDISISYHSLDELDRLLEILRRGASREN